MATQGSITTAPLPFGCGLTVYLCIFSPSRNGKAPHDGEARCSDRSNANTATYTKYIAHLFIEMQARYDYFLQFFSRFRDR